MRIHVDPDPQPCVFLRKFDSKVCTIVLFWLHGLIWSTLSCSVGGPDPHHREIRIQSKERKMWRLFGAIEAHPRVMDAHNQCFGSVFIFSGSGSRGWGWRPIRIRIRIRIQYGSRTLMTKNWKKITADKKKKKFYLSKTAIYLSLGLHKIRPSYRRSLQLTKEAIQHSKTWIFSTFVGHFCPPGSGSGFRIRIRIHWPDWIRIQSGSGSRSGSETLLTI